MGKRFRSAAVAVLATTATALSAAAATPATAAAPRTAVSHTPISGSGSPYTGVAIDLWAQDLRPRGIVVNYNPFGSAAGRVSFIQDQVDFAGSDEPFRHSRDKLGNTGPEIVPWSYSYVPDAGGAVAFPYHLSVHGHPFTSLRLSEKTVMEIFTGKITNWDDPQITRDNGQQLPDLPIKPVIHTEASGSGSNYYFTRWLSHVFPTQWNSFCEKTVPGLKPPCGVSEFYPRFGNAVAENGSNNIAAYIASGRGNGAIGMDEPVYAQASKLPVAMLGNPGGAYVAPTETNVTTALTQALIVENPHSPDFLQVDLNPLYTSKNPKSYLLSYSSYLIVPRTPKPPAEFASPAGKGKTLTTFVRFLLCHGQSQAAQADYAPLPQNLVKSGLAQTPFIPGHGPTSPTCP
ncbi:MAG TPA: substrate-binding domain-containing protein [Streptosporangiaceae bacterium]|nr:substrate-binding domain-containing protein [Streptosporangiaceae bacterium]